MNSIQALLVLFLFSFMVFKQKLVLQHLLYSFILGILCSLLESLSHLLFAPVNMSISTILTAALYFAVFKLVYRFSILKCFISMFFTMVLFIIASLGTAAILSILDIGRMFSDIRVYVTACLLTFSLYIIELLIIRFFRLVSKFPPAVRRSIFISNIAFLSVTVLIIICNMNYYVYMSGTENKWILIANCTAFLYMVYANVSSGLSLLKYKKLMEQHLDTVAELAAAKERNRFARDAHDTIGHTMSRIIALLEKCRISFKNAGKESEMITEAADYAREGLREIRRSIAGLIPESLECEDLEAALRELFSGFRSSGINIDFTMQGRFTGSVRLSGTVYRICQEAVSNAVRHGNALNITVALRFEEMLKLFICDDGTGCSEIKKGLGLSGMEQRIKELGGQLSFGSSDCKGFQIYATIPVE
ncbi:signal transduction histidine kinase [Anaerobacterium chartisolvens]|uniref:histidine kinase n=2 Tax=Anaerobacterium chartisolvens TaxID=1297424 RepID=A0A369BCT2_9FIRM|nr:signal transduction histidine kinase [Anaerobacterium chartisolvens]